MIQGNIAKKIADWPLSSSSNIQSRRSQMLVDCSGPLTQTWQNDGFQINVLMLSNFVEWHVSNVMETDGYLA